MCEEVIIHGEENAPSPSEERREEMLNLMRRARPDERFHVQLSEPCASVWTFGPLRVVTWTSLVNPDGSPGTFTSRWFWRFQYYSGTTKCDATRTIMMRTGQLGDPAPGFVMTTTPKELWAARWRSAGPQEAVWSSMGSA